MFWEKSDNGGIKRCLVVVGLSPVKGKAGREKKTLKQ